MKKEIFICDICKKEVERGDFCSIHINVRSDERDGNKDIGLMSRFVPLENDIDMCRECAGELGLLVFPANDSYEAVDMDSKVETIEKKLYDIGKEIIARIEKKSK